MPSSYLSLFPGVPRLLEKKKKKETITQKEFVVYKNAHSPTFFPFSYLDPIVKVRYLLRHDSTMKVFFIVNLYDDMPLYKGQTPPLSS